jgi:hypothetical protein
MRAKRHRLPTFRHATVTAMDNNPLIYFLAALIPFLVGGLWYSPALFDKAWRKASGVTEEQTRGGNMLLIFGLSYLFSLMAAASSAAGDEDATALVEDLMDRYGDKHRHFGHGALHGGIAAIFLALPIVGILALFERRRWTYVAIHAGYWFVSFTLMGGVLCQFL